SRQRTAPGPYALEAAIAAVHAEATDFAATDWPQIVVLYDLLQAVSPGPIVALNRAIAVGRCKGPSVGLQLLDRLSATPELARHRPYHVARAVTLEELGRHPEAGRAWEAVLDRTQIPTDQSYSDARLAAVEDRVTGSVCRTDGFPHGMRSALHLRRPPRAAHTADRSPMDRLMISALRTAPSIVRWCSAT